MFIWESSYVILTLSKSVTWCPLYIPPCSLSHHHVPFVPGRTMTKRKVDAFGPLDSRVFAKVFHTRQVSFQTFSLDCCHKSKVEPRRVVSSCPRSFSWHWLGSRSRDEISQIYSLSLSSECCNWKEPQRSSQVVLKQSHFGVLLLFLMK